MGLAFKPRLHPRWPVSLATAIVAGDQGAQGRITDLSLGGAFVETSAEHVHGSGIRLTFKLPNGMPVTATGRVVRVVAAAADTGRPSGVGIEFYGLDDATAEILRDYFATAQGGARAEHGCAQLIEKYRVETASEGRIYLHLSGFLDKADCHKLEQTMNETLAAADESGIRLCIDATQYQCCSPESVGSFRKCFESLATRPTFVAALVGPRSVGMMQIRRAARDAAVADSVASFDDVGEALNFLELM